MKKIKKADVTGPRFKKSWMTILNAKTWKAFKEKYPEHASLSLMDFKKIIMTFNDNIRSGVIENRNGVELPEGIGYIFMATCPTPKRSPIDFNKSCEMGVQVSYKNWDSDNKLLKIFYTNRPTKYPFHNKQVWAFNAGKPFRHKASVAYKEDFTKYLEVSPNIKISTMFERARKRDIMNNLKPIIPEGYDEFKL